MCYKAAKRPKAIHTGPRTITIDVENARAEYVNHLMESIIERSEGSKFNGTNGTGAMKQFQFKTKTCNAWNSFSNTKFKKFTGLCEPLPRKAAVGSGGRLSMALWIGQVAVRCVAIANAAIWAAHISYPMCPFAHFARMV